MKFQKLLYILFLGLGISACNKDDSGITDTSDLELTDQFTSSVFETFDETGKRSIWLYLETLEEFTCTNYQIEVDFRREDTDIYLDIKGLTHTANAPCQDGISKATAKIELGQLDISKYTIHLKLLDELEEVGEMLNTTSYVDMSFPAEGWMEVAHNRMVKVNSNIIWGYFLSENGHFDQLAADFNDGLEYFGAPLENDGYFGAFTVQQGQVKIILNEENTTTVYNGFGMNYYGDREELKNWILDNYCQHAGELGLLSTNGDLTPCE